MPPETVAGCRRVLAACVVACLCFGSHSVHAQNLYREVDSREYSLFSPNTSETREITSREFSIHIEPGQPDRELISRAFAIAVSDAEPPPPVGDLAITVSPTGDEVSLDWSSYNPWQYRDIAEFRIYISDSGPITDVSGLTAAGTTDGESTSLTLTGLTEFTDHFLAVVAVDSSGNFNPLANYSAAYVLSPESLSRELSLFVGAESTPTDKGLVSREFDLAVADSDPPPALIEFDVTVSPLGDAATLDWSSYNQWDNPPIDRFEIYLSDSGPITNVSGLTPFATARGGTTSIDLIALTPNNDHFFAIVPVDPLGNLDPAVNYGAAYVLSPESISRELSLRVGNDASLAFRTIDSREFSIIVPDAEAPPPVTGVDSGFFVETSTETFGAVVLDFSSYNESLVGDIIGYDVYVGNSFFDDVTGLTPFERLPAGMLRQTLVGLPGGSINHFAVVAVDSLGNFDPTVRSFSSQASISGVGEVENLNGSSTATTLAFSWEPPSDAAAFLDGYRVRLGDQPPVNLALSVTSFEAEGLMPGTGYPFRVSTVDIFGNESPGTSLNAATWLANPPNPRLTLRDGNVVLLWDAPEPESLVSFYRIYDSSSNFTDVSAITPLTTTLVTEATLGDISGVQDRWFAVTAVNGLGDADPAIVAVQASKQGQGIDFPQPSPTSSPIPLVAAATSGLPVSFAVTPSTTAIIADPDGSPALQILQGGPVEITASQEGNTNWWPAEPVVRSLRLPPVIDSLTVNGTELVDNAIVGNLDNLLRVTALDVDGITSAEFMLKPAGGIFSSIGNDLIPGDGLTAVLTTETLAPGSYELKVIVETAGGITAERLHPVIIQLLPPPSPTITSPLDGQSFDSANLSVIGTAQRGSSVSILREGTMIGGPATTDGAGNFSIGIPLVPGSNAIVARATNSAGPGPDSDAVVVSLRSILTLDLDPAALGEGQAGTLNIRRNHAQGSATVRFRASVDGQLSLPISTTLLDGDSETSGSVAAIDDLVAELDEGVVITAFSSGYVSANFQTTVIDDDRPSLTLETNRSSVAEGSPPGELIVTLSRSPVTDTPFTVVLDSSDNGSILPAGMVMIPGFVESVEVVVETPDNDLTDGDRSVFLSASILDVTTGEILTQSNEVSILVTDDDGPSLSLSLPKLALQEGTTTTAIVSRNGDTDSSLEVDLTCSDLTEATVPATVTIPIGSSSIGFPVAAVDDGVDDGNQPIVLDAIASGFSQAQLAATVTDLLLPDLAVTSLMAPESPLTEEAVQFSYRVENQGTNDTSLPIGVRIYLSSDAIVDPNDTKLSQFSFESGLPAGAYFERTESFFTPRETGEYRILVQIDAETAIEELLETNNVGATAPFSIVPAYTATVATDTTLAPSGTEVELAGQSTATGGGPAAFKLVNIHLMVRGTNRIIAALTNSNGGFAATFTPLPGEGGIYSIGAAHPGVDEAPVQDSFTLLGFSADPDELEVTPLRDGPEAVGSLELTNLTDFPLAGVTVAGFDLPSGISVSGSTVGPVTVEPLGTVTVEYRVSATAGAPAEADGFIRFTSPEGALLDVPVTVLVRENQSRLARDGGSLTAGMVPGGQRFVNFTVRNEGGVETGPVRVLTPPSFAWFTVASGSPLPSIPPGGSANISLQLAPPADFPLGVTTGTLVVSGDHQSLSVPFSFRSVSEGIGELVVRCEDEFTYFAANNPPLAGCTVRVIDPVTRQELASAVSGTDGLASFPGITAGIYELRATADKHGAVRSTVNVTAGGTTESSVFLQRSTVSYSWTVVPTEIVDRYRIVIETEFETNVPAPVVTVEPTYIDLKELPAETNQVEFTITNHGLIAANDLTLSFSSSPNWQIKALTSKLGRIPAKSQFKVPVQVNNLNGGRAGGCSPGGRVTWNYECGDLKVGGSVGVAFAGDGSNCGGGGGSVNPQGGSGGPGGRINPVGSASVGSCDPCVLKAIVDCGVGFIPYPPATCAYAMARFVQDCQGKGLDINCIIDAIQVGGGCACSFTPYGNACQAGNCFIDLLQCIAASGGGNGRSYDEILLNFDNRGRAVTALVELELAFLGDPAWVDLLEHEGIQEFFDLYKRVIDGDAPPSQRIDSSEQAMLLASMIGQSNPALMGELINRWNRTVDYWTAGILEADDVPSGQSMDFITATSVVEAATRAAIAYEGSQADGFEDPVDAFGHSVRDIFEFLSSGDGVCARVRLRIEQEAVMTRDGFDATLTLDNSGDAPLEDVEVAVRIRDLDGFDATDRFGVVGPVITGTSGSSVGGQSSGEWKWTLVPGQDAAPTGPVIYEVFGEMSYTLDGEVVTLPLLPQPLTVYPNPNLKLKYFHQRDVYSDDPFTDPIEPAIPFSLGVMIENTGAGVARNLSIASGQPEIIENDKGLLIDFSIIATQVAGQNLSPSLTADFGDLDPGQIKVAQWLMTSSLQGLFLNYSAEFEHLDDFGGKRTSLIESVDIYETIRAVRALGAKDDGLPDFLVNSTFDVLDLPDEIHLSDGSVEAVAVSRSASAGTPEIGNLSISLGGTGLGSGWGYLRVPDPGAGNFRLVSCVRSDGLVLPLDTNVWTTDRTFVGLGLRPIEEDLLHLVDCDSTGSYTLTYTVVEPPDTAPPTSSVAMLPSDSGSFIEVMWSGEDDRGVARYDIYVSVDGGPFELWLEETPASTALYTGSFGSNYDFYSIATDAAGNAEPPKDAGEASTSVSLRNQAPTLAAAGPLSVKEGETLHYRFVADDPDGPNSGLRFSLSSPNPGITLNPSTGRLRWITSEEDGGDSVEITVIVTDSDPEPLSATLTLSLLVEDTNAPPTLESPGSYVLDVGEPLELHLEASDGDQPAQTLRFRFAGGQPAGMTLDPVTGRINWVPGDSAEEQSFQISVQAYDDQTPEGFATQILFVEVLKKPGLPPAFDPFPALVWKTNGVHRFKLSATDPEGEPVTLSADISSLSGGWPSFRSTEEAGSGVLVWGTWGVAPGTYQVPATAATDRQSVTSQLTIEVVNRPPFNNYAGWAEAYDLSPADALENLSKNPLGLPNLIIYAMGLDPGLAIAPGQPLPGPSAILGVEGLKLSLPEAGLGRPDLRYVIQRSDNGMQSWTDVAVKEGHSSWTTSGSVGTTILRGNLMELALTLEPAPPTTPVFLRLTVEFLSP